VRYSKWPKTALLINQDFKTINNFQVTGSFI